MRKIDEVAAHVAALSDEIEALEARVKQLKAQRQELLTRELPDMMAEIGAHKLELDKYVLSLTEYVSGSIPKEPEARERAFAALERIGGGPIIKANVLAQLTKGELDEARRIAAAIERDFGREAKVDLNVHPQTLHAFIRERLRNGEPVPADDLGVQVGMITKVRKKA